MPLISAKPLSEARFKKLIKDAKEKGGAVEARDNGLRGLIGRAYPSGTIAFTVELERGMRRKVGDASLITLEQARRKAKKMMVRHADGEIIESSRVKAPTVKSFLKKEYRKEIEGRHKHPQASIDRLLVSVEPIEKVKLNKLSEFHLKKWEKARKGTGVSKSTFNRELASLKRALKVAQRLKLTRSNPATTIEPFKHADQPRVRHLSQAERKRLLKALRKRDHELREGRESGNLWRIERGKEPYPELGVYADYLEPLVLLVLNTGLRRNEALSLTWDKVKLTKNPELEVHWSVAKSQKTRKVPLNKTAEDVLTNWREQSDEGDLVFTRDGERMNDVRTSWKNLMSKAKIKDFRFHDLRHDFASQLVKKKVDLYRVKELLGHATIKTTERYAHLDAEALQNAVLELDS